MNTKICSLSTISDLIAFSYAFVFALLVKVMMAIMH